MKKIFIFLIFLFVIYLSKAQDKNHTNAPLKEHVYTIIFAGKKAQYMTAFKVKGYNGIITCLHGFATNCIIDKDFKKYKIDSIKSHDGYTTIYPTAKNSSYLLRVSKIDVNRDIAYIEVPFFATDDGFEIIENYEIPPNVESMNFGLYYFGGGRKILKRTDVKILDKSPLKQHVSKNFTTKYKIPNKDYSVLVSGSYIHGGNSGSPIFDLNNNKVIGIFGILADFDWSLASTIYMDSLQLYAEIVKNKNTAILKEMYYNAKRDTSQFLYKHKTVPPIFKSIKEKKKVIVQMDGEKIDTLPIKYPKVKGVGYPALKVLPQLYLLYKRSFSSFKCDIPLLYDIFYLKGEKKDCPSPIESNKSCKEHNKKIALRDDLQKNYLQSSAFIKALHLYAKASDKIDTKILEELINAANHLQLLDKIDLTRKEYKLWKKCKLNYFIERDILLEKMAHIAMNYNKDDSIIKNMRKGIDVIEGDTAAISLYKMEIIRKDTLFKEFRAKANSFVSANIFDSSYIYFLKALELKPDDIYSINKIKEIRKILADLSIQKKNENFTLLVETILKSTIDREQYQFYLPEIRYNIKKTLIGDKNVVLLSIKYGMSNENFIFNAIHANFPIGKYQYFEGDKANEIINSLLNSLFSAYYENMSKDSVFLTFIGHSDSAPFKDKLKYNENDFGKINTKNIYISNGEFIGKFNNLLNGNSDAKNSALAFLRAYGVYYSLKNTFENKIINDKKIKIENKFFIETHPNKGGLYRYVEVVIEFTI